MGSTSHLRWIAVAVLLRLASPATAALGEEPTVVAPSIPSFALEIVEPEAGVPIFGRQTLRIAVRPEQPGVRIVLHFDGDVVGELTEPPFVATVDAGQENRSHRIEVIAHATSGESATAVLVTPSVRIDDQTDLDLRQIYLTATRRGERVLDLRAEDFAVVDGGVRQELVTFENGDVPFTAVLLIDASESMHGKKLQAALSGAEGFVRSMKELDEARIVVASDRIQTVSPFVGPDGDLLDFIAGATASGATTLHDQLFLALRSLESRQGRRVVILLSDGDDTHSVLRMAEVRDVARRSRSMVYWLRLARPGDLVPRATWRSPQVAEENRELLFDSVRETGGRVLDVKSPQQMQTALQEILAELREQYVIGYYPQPAGPTGEWRDVEVEIDRRRIDLRYRPRYLDR